MTESVPTSDDIAPLVDLFSQHRPVLIVSGAGLSTASGIPDYRDKNGEWKRKTPIYHQQFIDDHEIRQRYWARSLLGWRHFSQAEPNGGHDAIAQLEQWGLVNGIITQNVDQLHQRAGSKNVIDLHGRIGDLKCLSCDYRVTREDFQRPLTAQNPHYSDLAATIAPDGDADLNLDSFADFNVPPCPQCDGTIMPDVVFYGGNVPKPRVERAMQALHEAGAILVVGSSLMVYSSYRFCIAARDANQPIGAINMGVTRADDLFAFKIEQHCDSVLQLLVEHLAR